MAIFRIDYAVESTIEIEADNKIEAEYGFWKMAEADGIMNPIEGSVPEAQALMVQKIRRIKE